MSCTGLFDGIYDEAEEVRGGGLDTTELNVTEDTVRTTLYIEANRWDCWYYIDLHAVQRVALQFAEAGDTASTEDFSFEPYTIPTSLTDRVEESTCNGEVESTCNGEVESTCNGEVESTCNGEVESTCNGEVESTCNGEVESTGNGDVESSGNGDAESTGNREKEETGDGREENSGAGEECAYNHTYRFRILTGEGLSDYTCMDTTAVDPQPEPEQWDFAIHRNNVRTNGGAALETHYTSLDELPANSSLLLDSMVAAGQDTTFRADTRSERDVWIDNSNMIKELIPCQSIDINEVISRWLTIKIPPIPPTFNHRGNVYLLRMSDGSVAALRMANYMSAKGVKCCMTIEVKYPY